MSLAATMLNAIRIKSEKLDKNEHRLSEYGAFDFFVQQSESNPILSAEMKEQAKKSMGKTLQTPVIKFDGNIEVSNVRSCTIADAENESALVGLVFVTYAVGFTTVPAMYSNNEIDEQTDVERKFKKCARVLGAALDEAALTALSANKSQVFADTLIYTESSDVIQVPWESREDILSDVEPIMEANDFRGRVHIIGNAGVRSLLNKLMEKGENNIVDKRLEWAGKEFHFSNRLSNAASTYATFYAVEDGNVDLVLRYDREAARGTKTANGHEWGVINMPYLDIPVGYHYYEAVGDQSAIAGDATTDLTCGVKKYYGFSVDVAFVVAYNSDIANRANPIIEVEIASGKTYAQPVFIANDEDAPVPTKEIV